MNLLWCREFLIRKRSFRDPERGPERLSPNDASCQLEMSLVGCTEFLSWKRSFRDPWVLHMLVERQLLGRLMRCTQWSLLVGFVISWVGASLNIRAKTNTIFMCNFSRGVSWARSRVESSMMKGRYRGSKFPENEEMTQLITTTG